MNKPKTFKHLLCAAVLIPIGSAQATFTLLENFEGLAAGGLDSQNGWTAGAEFTLVNDPAGGANQVLQYSAGAQSGAYRSLGGSAISTTGTLFARFRFESTANANLGLTDVAAPAGYGDFRVQINRQNGTPLKGRDGGAFVDLDTDSSSAIGDVADEGGTWYNIWMLADNSSDSTRVFLQSDGDALFATQTEVFPTDGTLNFRAAAPGDLGTLMLRAQEGTAYFDDFYVSAGTDLSNPTAVPEPSSSIMLLVGMAGILRRRRG